MARARRTSTRRRASTRKPRARTYKRRRTSYARAAPRRRTSTRRSSIFNPNLIDGQNQQSSSFQDTLPQRYHQTIQPKGSIYAGTKYQPKYGSGGIELLPYNKKKPGMVLGTKGGLPYWVYPREIYDAIEKEEAPEREALALKKARKSEIARRKKNPLKGLGWGLPDWMVNPIYDKTNYFKYGGKEVLLDPEWEDRNEDGDPTSLKNALGAWWDAPLTNLEKKAVTGLVSRGASYAKEEAKTRFKNPGIRDDKLAAHMQRYRESKEEPWETYGKKGINYVQDKYNQAKDQNWSNQIYDYMMNPKKKDYYIDNSILSSPEKTRQTANLLDEMYNDNNWEMMEDSGYTQLNRPRTIQEHLDNFLNNKPIQNKTATRIFDTRGKTTSEIVDPITFIREKSVSPWKPTEVMDPFTKRKSLFLEGRDGTPGHELYQDYLDKHSSAGIHRNLEREFREEENQNVLDRYKQLGIFQDDDNPSFGNHIGQSPIPHRRWLSDEQEGIPFNPIDEGEEYGPSWLDDIPDGYEEGVEDYENDDLGEAYDLNTGYQAFIPESNWKRADQQSPSKIPRYNSAKEFRDKFKKLREQENYNYVDDDEPPPLEPISYQEPVLEENTYGPTPQQKRKINFY